MTRTHILRTTTFLLPVTCHTLDEYFCAFTDWRGGVTGGVSTLVTARAVDHAPPASAVGCAILLWHRGNGGVGGAAAPGVIMLRAKHSRYFPGDDFFECTFCAQPVTQ